MFCCTTVSSTTRTTKQDIVNNLIKALLSVPEPLSPHGNLQVRPWIIIILQCCQGAPTGKLQLSGEKVHIIHCKE